MSNKTIESLREGFIAFGVALLVAVALGIAGRMDYQDAVLAEMKTNGRYYELEREHPKATDLELVRMYELERQKAAPAK